VAASGRLTGLIDFTDAMVGEVVHDFAGLIGIGGVAKHQSWVCLAFSELQT
jgi:hypothetical protein